MRYQVTGYFESDRPLSDDELSVLQARLELELAEPIDMDSERVDWVRVGDFGISVIKGTLWQCTRLRNRRGGTDREI